MICLFVADGFGDGFRDAFGDGFDIVSEVQDAWKVNKSEEFFQRT